MPAPASPEHLGPYRLLHELGRGGQAVVWLAEDTRLPRRVALKVLPTLGPGSDALLRRFRREAEVTSRLDHPGICPIFEADVERDVPYLAMRYVEGETLARRIAAAREGGRLPVALRDGEPGDFAALATFFARAARALHAAHEAGVLHRDVKPANLMVTPAGEPVVLDFGLARDDDADAVLSRSGAQSGTPTYMSPEQMTGRVPLDRRGDVYSLGCSLFECLTGRPPFQAPTLQALLHAVLHEAVPDVRKLTEAVPADLAVVTAMATHRDRDRRYRTALDFAEDLERVVRREPIAARPITRWQRLASWCRRQPALAASLAAAVALSLVAAAATSYGLGAADRAALAAQLRDRAEDERRRLAAEQQRARQAAADRQLAERLDELAMRLGTLAFGVQGGAEGLAGLVPAHLAALRAAGLDLEAADAVERGKALLQRLAAEQPAAAHAVRDALHNLVALLPAGSPLLAAVAPLTGALADPVHDAFTAARRRWLEAKEDTFAPLLTEPALAPLSVDQLAMASSALRDVPGREAIVIDLIDRAIRQQPDAFALHYRRAGLSLGRAVVGGKQGPASLPLVQEACAHFRTAVALRPGSGLARAALAGALALRAHLANDDAGFAASYHWLQTATEVEPDNALVWFLRADYLQRMPGARTEAEAACRRALALEPELAPARRLLASLTK